METYLVSRSELAQQMDSGLFSLGTDGSNDKVGTDGSNDQSGIKKLNPVLIRWFGDNKGKVSPQLLDMGDGKRVPLRHFLTTSNLF